MPHRHNLTSKCEWLASHAISHTSIKYERMRAHASDALPTREWCITHSRVMHCPHAGNVLPTREPKLASVNSSILARVYSRVLVLIVVKKFSWACHAIVLVLTSSGARAGWILKQYLEWVREHALSCLFARDIVCQRLVKTAVEGYSH